MKKVFSFFAVCLMMAGILFAQYSSSKEPQKLPEKTLTIVTKSGITKTLTAEMARTPREQAKGYMFRKNIPMGTGMLFVFHEPQILSFWMKNTPHPLSIAYITEKGKIAEIYDMEPFDLTPIEGFVPCKYALEVPKGWFVSSGITAGDMLKLDF